MMLEIGLFLLFCFSLGLLYVILCQEDKINDLKRVVELHGVWYQHNDPIVKTALEQLKQLEKEQNHHHSTTIEELRAIDQRLRKLEGKPDGIVKRRG